MLQIQRPKSDKVLVKSGDKELVKSGSTDDTVRVISQAEKKRIKNVNARVRMRLHREKRAAENKKSHLPKLFNRSATVRQQDKERKKVIKEQRKRVIGGASDLHKLKVSSNQDSSKDRTNTSPRSPLPPWLSPWSPSLPSTTTTVDSTSASSSLSSSEVRPVSTSSSSSSALSSSEVRPVSTSSSSSALSASEVRPVSTSSSSSSSLSSSIADRPVSTASDRTENTDDQCTMSNFNADDVGKRIVSPNPDLSVLLNTLQFNVAGLTFP